MPPGSRKVLTVGTSEAFGGAVARAFAEEGFDVIGIPKESTTTIGDCYAVVLTCPVLVHDFGDARPRRFSVGVDPFGDADPRDGARWVEGDQRLGTVESRRFVEAVATPGTRIAMVSASLLLDPNPRGELDGMFTASEVPLLFHTQRAMLREPLARALPSIWSVAALPSGRRDGFGLGGFFVLHAPPEPFDRTDQLLASARDLVADLARLR